LILIIASPVRTRLAQFFTESLPREASGFVLGREHPPQHFIAEQALPGKGDAQIGRFEISGHDIAWARAYAAERGLRIIALYHSHPSGEWRLSSEDIAAVRHSEWPWIVVTIEGERIRLNGYRPGDAQPIPVSADWP
jgi:proteasome lid subunit RPN8/RPN11